ncbi:MAG: TetR/AcrR family transcriptional regulator [Acidimicrobiales bacterium]
MARGENPAAKGLGAASRGLRAASRAVEAASKRVESVSRGVEAVSQGFEAVSEALGATGLPVSKGERTRAALLAAAIDRFGRDGYRAASVADIARDAGLSPTAAYAYFPNKEALFTAAVDEDAAGEIGGALSAVLEGEWNGDWRELISTLVDGLDHHPLARRMLAGLEPDFTERMLGIAALAELRKGLAELLAGEQGRGQVRADIDPHLVAGGLVTIVISLLIAILQTGADATGVLGDEVVAVLEACLH